MQLSPQCVALGLTQFQDVDIHPLKGAVFTRQAIVTPLQGDEMIPDGGGDKEFMPQLLVLLVAAVQTILVGFADFDYACHALTPRRLESWWARQRRDQHLYSTKLLFDMQCAFYPHT
jgi:hypothetical protein